MQKVARLTQKSPKRNALNFEGDFLDTRGEDARQLPERWGRWFVPIAGGNMYQLLLSDFYFLGKALTGLSKVESGMTRLQAAVQLSNAHMWLNTFLSETKETDKQLPVPHSKQSVVALMESVSRIIRDGANKDETIRNSQVTWVDRMFINSTLKTFEDDFARESLELGVFVVTPKGDRSTRILLDDAAKKFEANIRAVLPQKTLDDLREAGKCLAFERATACAFHICRATEALMLCYYEKLAGHPWPHSQKDWGIYNRELIALNAPERITTRLNEIRKMDRNAYAHPDVTVPLDEAPILYDLCTAVMFFIAKEMV